MKSVVLGLSVILALAAGAAAAESKTAKKFDAGPAIQGNSDPATPMHRKTVKRAVHKKPM